MAELINKIMRLRERKKISKNKRLHQNRILVLGGFGYSNVGDEAQLDVVLKRLADLFPECLVKVLSPNPTDTFRMHDGCYVDFAPRVSFFRENESLLYSIKADEQCVGIIEKVVNLVLKFLFLVKSEWILWNSILDRVGLPTFLLSTQASGLLYDIKTSKMIYFEGGGYLTGMTLSRLWDGILICRLAKNYGVPVVMSGQTIGVWNTKFNIRYARKAFASVKLLTLRDAEESLNDLKKLGISTERFYPVCDDALFCKKEDGIEKIQQVLKKSSIDTQILKDGYIIENIHDWGVSNKIEEVLESIYEINEIIKSKIGKCIVFVPMTPSDEKMMRIYNEKYTIDSIPIVKHEYNFKIVRGIIGQASYCFTMKHHPIIFSIGECVPCIALNYSDYYKHKNCGALNILGVGKYFINLEENDYKEKAEILVEEVVDRYENIIEIIKENLANKDKLIKNFEQQLLDLMNNKS